MFLYTLEMPSVFKDCVAQGVVSRMGIVPD